MAFSKGIILGLLVVQIIIAAVFIGLIWLKAEDDCNHRKVTRTAIHRTLDMDDRPELIDERQAIRRDAPIPEC